MAKYTIIDGNEVETIEFLTKQVNDKGLFQIDTNLPINAEFLSMALFDESVRDKIFELEIIEKIGDHTFNVSEAVLGEK